MNVEPESLEALIAEFAGLPGIGQKTARRLAYHVLTRPKSDVERFAENLTNAIEKVHPCPKCHAFTDQELCPTCTGRAGAKSLCVVEKSSDIIPFERSGIFKGLYFVLGGVLSPLDGIGPEHLHLPQLAARVKDEGIAPGLLEDLAEDGDFPLTEDQIGELLDPALYTGCAQQQTESFLKEVVDPLLAAHETEKAPVREIEL